MTPVIEWLLLPLSAHSHAGTWLQWVSDFHCQCLITATLVHDTTYWETSVVSVCPLLTDTGLQLLSCIGCRFLAIATIAHDYSCWVTSVVNACSLPHWHMTPVIELLPLSESGNCNTGTWFQLLTNLCCQCLPIVTLVRHSSDWEISVVRVGPLSRRYMTPGIDRPRLSVSDHCHPGTWLEILRYFCCQCLITVTLVHDSTYWVIYVVSVCSLPHWYMTPVIERPRLSVSAHCHTGTWLQFFSNVCCQCLPIVTQEHDSGYWEASVVSVGSWPRWYMTPIIENLRLSVSAHCHTGTSLQLLRSLVCQCPITATLLHDFSYLVSLDVSVCPLPHWYMTPVIELLLLSVSDHCHSGSWLQLLSIFGSKCLLIATLRYRTTVIELFLLSVSGHSNTATWSHVPVWPRADPDSSVSFCCIPKNEPYMDGRIGAASLCPLDPQVDARQFFPAAYSESVGNAVRASDMLTLSFVSFLGSLFEDYFNSSKIITMFSHHTFKTAQFHRFS